MACSNQNILKNGNFNDKLSNWTGSQMQLTSNPLSKKDSCVLMGNKNTLQNPILLSTLKQDVAGPFEGGCAYYLQYQILHRVPLQKNTMLYATVVFLDTKRRIINSTPLYILPSKMPNHWSHYTSIVPPPPKGAASLSVSFILKQGMMYIGDIQLASRTIKK